MKAIIMAAGFATRLYPLTKNVAKPLLKVKGKPIIDYIVEKIQEIEDIDEVIVITNNKFYNDFKKWGEERSYNNLVLLNNGVSNLENKKGSIGDLVFAIEHSSIDENLLVISGDNLFKSSLKDAYDLFKKEDKNLAIFYDTKSIEEAKRLGVALIEGNILVNFEEKPENPKSTLCSASTYFYKQEILPLLKEFNKNAENKDYPGLFLEFLYKSRPIFVNVVEDWIDIGTHEALRRARESF